MIIKHVRHNFGEIHDADWLRRQTPITWLFVLSLVFVSY